MDAKLEEEVNLQGAIRVTSSPVEGTFKPASTRTAATCR